MSEHVNVEFITPSSVGPRQWGEELLVGLLPGVYSAKVLKINAGHKGGLQRHQLKNEIAHLFFGEMNFYYDLGDGNGLQVKRMKAGDSVHIPPGAVHREEAITDCVVFEASTPHFNDRVRMEPDYGETIPEGGLPSSTIDQIETR